MFENIRNDYRTHGRTWTNRGLWAMTLYRFGRWALGVRLPPLRWALGKTYGLLNLFSPVFTGVAMDRMMDIGRDFHIVHPGLVVLHVQAVFGDRCGVMHNVTVGQNMSGGAPRFGNDVFIGTGASVLGEITIGDGAWIAANSLVVSDVPAGALAMGVPARVYPGRGHGPFAAEARRTMAERLQPTPAGDASPAAASLFRGVASDVDAGVR
jgi:serine O-acetyltransferase